jgi:amino acid transporter
MLTLSAATIFNIIVSWTLSWFLSSISLIQLASAVKEPAWIFIIGTIFVIIGALLNMFPRRYMSWFYKVTIGLSLIGAAIVIVILLSGLGKFPALFTAVTGVDYNSIIPLAIQNGFKTGFSWSATILTLAWLGPFWLGFGGIYIAGEVKDIKKSVLWATLWAQVALMISYIVFTGVNYIVTGYTWYNALSWLYDNAPDVYPLSVSPEIQNIATIIAPHPLVGPIIAFTMFFSMLSLVPVFHIWISRPTFTWAFDRLLPEKYTEVSEKFHTPIISIVITTIIIEIGLATSAFIGLFPVWLNLSWMGVIVILISSLSGILLPYKAKTIFEGAPGIARAKVAGVPLVSIGGAGTLFFTLLFIVSAALYPSINPLSVPQMLLIAVWFIVGLIIFYAIRSYRMKQGIDITLAYKEIPPE